MVCAWRLGSIQSVLPWWTIVHVIFPCFLENLGLCFILSHFCTPNKPPPNKTCNTLHGRLSQPMKGTLVGPMLHSQACLQHVHMLCCYIALAGGEDVTLSSLSATKLQPASGIVGASGHCSCTAALRLCMLAQTPQRPGQLCQHWCILHCHTYTLCIHNIVPAKRVCNLPYATPCQRLRPPSAKA